MEDFGSLDKLPDFQAMLHYIAEAGVEDKTLLNAIGISRRQLELIRSERAKVDLTALKLLRVFLDSTEKDVPYLGVYVPELSNSLS